MPLDELHLRFIEVVGGPEDSWHVTTSARIASLDELVWNINLRGLIGGATNTLSNAIAVLVDHWLEGAILHFFVSLLQHLVLLLLCEHALFFIIKLTVAVEEVLVSVLQVHLQKFVVFVEILV
jgi:hypothetical protein